MTWRIDGIGKTYRQAAEKAADKASMPLGQWLDQVIRSHPAGPTRDDADADITKALAALENRINQSSTHIDKIIDPLREQVAHLETQSKQVLNPDSHLQNEAAREINRRLDQLDREASADAGGPTDTAAGKPRRREPTRRATRGPTRGEPDSPDILPPLSSIKRHHILRLIAGLGTIAMLAVLGTVWIWLWYDHEQLAITKPPLTKPKLLVPSADRTPPAVAGVAAPQNDSPATPATAAHIRALKTRAQAQDTEAAYELGMALLQGQGVAINTRAGGEWIAQAALDGHAKAQLELGRLYAQGIGFRRDSQQAFFWIQSAADQGVTEAEHALGMIYTQGNGTARSHALAARWFRKAGEKNFAPSLYQLGLIYELGLDYRVNKRRALDWYRKASAAGSAEAANKARILEAAGILPSVLSPAPPSSDRPAAPQKKESVRQPALDKAGIAEIQRLLKSLDFDPGPADGKPGTKTAEAIRLYQGMAGLPVDGKASQKLLDQIREVTGAPKR